MSEYKCVAGCVRPSFCDAVSSITCHHLSTRGRSPLVSGDETKAAPTKTREWLSARSVVGAERTASSLSVFPPTVLARTTC
jgi:hypothetical protein